MNKMLYYSNSLKDNDYCNHLTPMKFSLQPSIITPDVVKQANELNFISLKAGKATCLIIVMNQKFLRNTSWIDVIKSKRPRSNVPY